MHIRSVSSFNNDWKFYLGDVDNGALESLDDTNWRTLNLPHDWAVEGEFSPNNPSGTGGGALPGGVGWYRKTFVADEYYQGKKVYIDFDGVYMNSQVYINGTLLGKRPYGYISFRYDLTPYLKYGEENVVAVRVDNAEQPNSRWYSGCGIYRNVWLTVVNPVHVDLWGTYVTTPVVSEKEASVSVKTTVRNDGKQNKELELHSLLLDAEGRTVAQTYTTLTVETDSKTDVEQMLLVENPKLWSIENPYLYTLLTQVVIDGEIVDDYTTQTGIRYFKFDAAKGFFS